MISKCLWYCVNDQSLPFYCLGAGRRTLNQSILVLKRKKREGKEYSEGLRPSFVRY